MTLALTSVNAAALGNPSNPAQAFTELRTNALGTNPNPARYVTAVRVNFLGLQPAPQNRISRVYFNVLATRFPSYRFNQVILPDVFPYDISYNSVGSIRFATDVIVVDSGDDQRTIRWDQPLMEYDIAYGVRTMEQLHALQSFFRAMRGRAYAFNYRDVVDHTSTIAAATEARAAPPISPTDQRIGTGDGRTYQFQLTKTYATPSRQSNQVRPITRPEPGTVRIALNGAEMFDFTVDLGTGIVTLLSPVTATIGHGIDKGTPNGANVATFTGHAGDFSAFLPYVATGRGIIVNGCAHVENNAPQSIYATIANAAGDGSTISIAYPPGYGGPTESHQGGLTFSISPAPAPNDVLTAGFKFFVPVRFDTDTLPVQLEDYGIGSSNSIKLIEVRPSAW